MPAYTWGDNGYGEGPYGGDGNVAAVDLSPDIAVYDHVAIGLSRLAKQYQGSPKLIAFLTALLTLSNQVEDTLQSLKYLTDIDQMTGVNLDVIGRIVGQTRYIGEVVQLVYFGFAPQAAPVINGIQAVQLSPAIVTTFGEETEPNHGSRLLEEGEDYAGTSVLDDVEFRLLIRGRIIKNASNSTPESLLTSLNYLFSTNAVNVDSNGHMTIGVAIGRLLSPIERVIVSQLNLLPRPAGVSLSSIVNYNLASYLGFFGQNKALTFTEEGLNNGAVLAEEIPSL